jgi:TonB-linked SusC/RagA family outer membrane protein
MRQIVFIFMILTSACAFAQRVNIEGAVVDDNGQPLSYVSVIVKGSQTGTVTNTDGKFKVATDKKSTLVFSFVGYETTEVSVSGQSSLRIVLKENTVAMKDVVVTALGIKREKKSLGYAVQDVKADELTKAGSTDVTSALQGKVAGLSINTSGTGAGGSAKVVIRGNSSLADNNEPLWIVDGIPYNNSTETGNYQWGGYDRAGGSFDLNPEDIESISVLKGATAAALYGSRAGNGVILVTTKKGDKNKNLGITYTYKMTASPVAYSLDLQNTYGQGSNGVYSSTSQSSWGAPMQGQSIAAWWDGTQTTTYSVQKDLTKNFYRTGGTQSHNVSLSGGTDKSTYRASLGNDYTKGNVPNQSIQKTDFDVVSKHTINKYLDFETKANYVNTVGKNRPLLGYYSTMYYLYTMPRSIQLNDLSAHRFNANDLSAGTYTEQNWTTANASYRNPYFLLSQENNKDVKDRFFGYAQANVKFTDDLKLKIKQGLDYSGTQYTYNYNYADAVETTYPMMTMTKDTYRELNTEILLSYNKQFRDFSLGLSAGANRMYTKTESLYGYSGKFAVVGSAAYLSLGTDQKTSNSIYEKEINSVYGFMNLGYKDYLYLDVTARNDWSSTLPSSNRSYFYPSFSLSGLITEALSKYGISYPKDVITYGKVRASFAQVGKDTDPYQLKSAYSTSTGGFNYLYAYESTTLANENLKPEIATSYEIGTEWKFLKNRLGLDFTYYNTVTKNQVLDIPYTYSAGYTSQTANVGKISNKGIELTLSGTPIKTKNFSLDLTLNLAKNKTMVDELASSVSMYEFGSLNNGLKVVAIEGHKLGEIYDYGYKKDSKGNLIIGSDGLPERTDSQEVLGCIQPDFTGSFALGATYKGFSLSALFAFQKGGDVYSYTEAAAAYAGTAACTEDRNSRVISGVTESGTANTVSVTAQNYWQNGVTAEQFIYDASYIKLKEVSLGYSVPKTFLRTATHNIVDNLRISLVGSNLLYLLKHTPGTTPDGSAMSSNIFSQAVDFSPVPNTRTYGFTVNVGF